MTHSIVDIKDLSEVIRTRRRAQGLTQAQLAGVSNTGIRFIVDLEGGKATCQIGKVLRVLQHLGIRLEAKGVENT